MHATDDNRAVADGSQIGFAGACGYAVDGDRVVVSVQRLENRRPVGNVSGTLAIEFWALPESYAGADFSGHALAATLVGELHGQRQLADCRYDLIYQPPPEGVWHLCLMVREWDGSGYETRDFVNFALPYQGVKGRAGTPTDDVDVLEVAFDLGHRKAVPSAVRPASVHAERSPRVETGPGETSRAAPQASADEPAVTLQSTGSDKPEAEPSLRTLSVNKATAKELAGIKGVSRKLAKRIVDARPFATWKAVREVKGLDKKALHRLKKRATL